MYFQYGNYQHDANSVNLKIKQTVEKSARGYRWMVRHTWDLEFIVGNTDQATIRSAIQAAEEAYSYDGYDAGLYHDNGSVSAHYLDSNQSFGGVRVVAKSFPKGDQTEYATLRTCNVTLEAEFIQTAYPNLLELTETIEYTGTGGPRFLLVETATGPVQRQQTNVRTARTATQSGRAVGMTSYPAIIPPFMPANEHVDQRRITKERWIDGPNGAHTFPVSWSYAFSY